MATVAQSAGISAAQLFGAIGSAASTLTTAFEVLGSGAEAVSLKTDEWLTNTRNKCILDRTLTKKRQLQEATQAHHDLQDEAVKYLQRNPQHAATYETVYAELKALLEPQQQATP